MKIKLLLTAAIGSLVAGCSMEYYPTTYSPEPYDPPASVAYVNTYIPLPADVQNLIAPRVDGYFSPQEYRYGTFLYNQEFARSSTNLPCYVRGDFNGDGLDDYAFLFTDEDWYTYSWKLTTKLVVVLSTSNGYTIATDTRLGSVTADRDVPVEEYWSLCILPRGTYDHTYYENGVEIIETVTIDDDAFLLTAFDSGERDLFYAGMSTMYYMTWENGCTSCLGKKKAGVTIDDNAWQKQVVMKKLPGVSKAQ